MTHRILLDVDTGTEKTVDKRQTVLRNPRVWLVGVGVLLMGGATFLTFEAAKLTERDMRMLSQLAWVMLALSSGGSSSWNSQLGAGCSG